MEKEYKVTVWSGNRGSYILNVKTDDLNKIANRVYDAMVFENIPINCPVVITEIVLVNPERYIKP